MFHARAAYTSCLMPKSVREQSRKSGHTDRHTGTTDTQTHRTTNVTLAAHALNNVEG